MREFVYFSNKAVTSGKYLSGNLMHAGRMDIAIHVLINSLFLSHKIREKTKIHLIFNGPPNPPQHLIIFPDGKKSSGKIQLSKKDVAGLIYRGLGAFIGFLNFQHNFQRPCLKHPSKEGHILTLQDLDLYLINLKYLPF